MNYHNSKMKLNRKLKIPKNKYNNSERYFFVDKDNQKMVFAFYFENKIPVFVFTKDGQRFHSMKRKKFLKKYSLIGVPELFTSCPKFIKFNQ